MDVTRLPVVNVLACKHIDNGLPPCSEQQQRHSEQPVL